MAQKQKGVADAMIKAPDRSPMVQVNIKNLIDEVQCYQTVRVSRWPDSINCPSCQSKEVIKRDFDDIEPARQRYECHGCNRRFDDLTDTIVACDFCVAVTATFRLLYVFVVMEHASRRILHVNVTAHPTAQWTLQRLREAIPADHAYRFVICDRDSIFSRDVDQRIRHLRLRVLKTPPRCPQANAICERVLGTLRQEALDFVIPLTDNHLRCMVTEWVRHYNQSRPHMSLGPGIPEPPALLPVPLHDHRHRLPPSLCVGARRILGGLHHDYRLEQKVA